MPEPHDPSIRIERTFYPDGTPKEEIHYKGSLHHGPWRKWHPNGQLAEEYWLEDGVYTTCTNRMWHPNGVLKAEIEFANGRGVQTRVYSEHGKLTAQMGPQHGQLPIRKWIKRAMAAKAKKATLNPDEAATFDSFAKARLAGGVTAEARQWLRDGRAANTRTLGELDADTALELILGLYVMGAKSVLAVEIARSDADAYESSNQLVVQLPTHDEDPAARARIFSMERAVSQEQGFDATPDRGQTYLYLKLC